MWPLSITVGVGGRAIAVGTDADEVVQLLEPWRIPDAGDPTDFCVELYPPVPRRGEPQPIPGLYHGSTALLRSRDRNRLTTALLRVLNSFANPADTRQFRIGLMPIVRRGVALLAPPATVSGISERWLATHDIEAFAAMSSLVDPDTARVLIDPPLGHGDDATSAAFGGWWLAPQSSNGTLSPGFAVAELMTLAVDVTADNAAFVLQAVASLVERVPPVVAPRSAATAQLLAAFDAAPVQ